MARTLIKLFEVMNRTRLSEKEVLAMVKAGEFPRWMKWTPQGPRWWDEAVQEWLDG